MNRYLIIADDFTGANDTGVQIRRKGAPVRVVFSSRMMSGGDSYVIDTESRALSGEEAYARVLKALETVDFSGFTVVKKVDSTLRGNIAEEIKAVDEAYGSELIIFAPALPDLNRTTLKCVHMLNGVPITRTELALDPKTPVKEDNIQKLLQKVYEEPVCHIGIEAVRESSFDFSGGRIFTCDAVTNDDMAGIIAAAKRSGRQRILWVGTAAMADNLLNAEGRTKPSFALVESLSNVSSEQVKYAEKQGVALVHVRVHEMLSGKSKAQDYISSAVELLNGGRDVIMLSSASYDRSEYDLAVKQGIAAGYSAEEVSRYTQKVMGEMAKAVLENAAVSGLFLTGGDAAIGFLDAAGSTGSSIITEIAVGVPLMKLCGGCFDGLKIVTKAGAFGREDTIFFSLRKLKEVI